MNNMLRLFLIVVVSAIIGNGIVASDGSSYDAVELNEGMVGSRKEKGGDSRAKDTP